MLLVGIGQGLAFAPLTSVGIAGVDADDAGAASGLFNTFHRFGMALGLSILLTVSAHAAVGEATPADGLTAEVSTALGTGGVLLVLSLLVGVVLILPAEREAGRRSSTSSVAQDHSELSSTKP